MEWEAHNIIGKVIMILCFAMGVISGKAGHPIGAAAWGLGVLAGRIIDEKWYDWFD